MKWLRRFWQMLEKGHAKQTCTDLYSNYAMDRQEYLERIKEIDK